MRKITVSTALRCFLLLFLTLGSKSLPAQNKLPDRVTGASADFALNDGERVVLLGNSLFENDLQYGYLELALTTRWPRHNVTFRNIGWTGDTVWGDARSHITSPPSAYDLLVDQIKKARPTLVFIAYGAIEAQEGEAGLPRFNQGLNKLLDLIDQLGAKAVLLSPIPLLAEGTGEEVRQRNAMLEQYGATIARTASARGQRYIDLFKPLQQISSQVKLSDNGLHLNATGYYHLAATVEAGLGLAPRQVPVVINISKRVATAAAPARILHPGQHQDNLTFTIDAACLPLPLPQQDGGTLAAGQVLQVKGLKRGYYTLTTDGAQVITASAKKWAEGIAINQGAVYSQASALQEQINKKNELFFHQYRPPNRTYILGFRAYEQGRHAAGLEDLNYIITWLEGQIALNRSPKLNVYQLTPIK